MFQPFDVKPSDPLYQDVWQRVRTRIGPMTCFADLFGHPLLIGRVTHRVVNRWSRGECETTTIDALIEEEFPYRYRDWHGRYRVTKR